MIEPFDPLQFLSLARELAREDDDEARVRTAVARAYYAVFLVSREKAAIRGRRNVHERVIQAVKQRRGYRSTGDQLDALRRLRTVADYDLSPNDPDDRNWAQNWSRAQDITDRVLPRLLAW